ncbi:translation elongation factor Ts [[Mycoplasma] testudinis]|uniref:translation elongation factor Ts n=1 Tax=[Mycoplasma] testudinis TaxID=33924 RepID=UPI000481CBB6|nr:translation elongation factor Ts [[Mycoplasma] testudinis]
MSNQSELIKQLRASTQAGFMDCKKALDACNNDLEAAVKWLRENGIAKAAKKVDNVAAEGIISLHVEGNKGLLLEVNSQTDFVTKNDKFLAFINELTKAIFMGDFKTLDEAKNAKLASGKTVTEQEIELTATIGEKISLRRFAFVTAKADEVIGSYLHANKRIGVLLALKQTDTETSKHLAMHVAASNPKFISEQHVDKKWLDGEKEVILAQVEGDETVAEKLKKVNDETKKADLKNKIIEGRIHKLLAESCLDSQVYLIDSTKKVGQFLKEKSLTVNEMIRYEVGEGIEKKVTDFAEEVRSQMK